MPLLRLALASLLNRRATALLTVFAIALAVALLLGVERVRQETRHSFLNTVSGTDLIVGARTGPVNLLLYAVFRIGNASAGIQSDSFRHFATHPQVRWAIPLALGDSHRGYPVLGTTGAYFEHYRYGQRQPLALAEGRTFADDGFEVVLGAEVAQALGYRLGDRLVLAHGTARISLHKHNDHPFRVVGILAPTGTPADRTLHVALTSLAMLHHRPGHAVHAEEADEATGHAHAEAPPVTAFMLGLHSRPAALALQREINQYRDEPLLAILPGVALQELWSLMGTAEQALRAVSLCVVLTGLLGMLTALLASLNERRREMAILRAVGARPAQVAGLLLLETLVLTLAGILLGLALLQAGIALARTPLQSLYGLSLTPGLPSLREAALLGGLLLAALLSGAIPAWRAYRQSLSDGLSIRL